MVLLYVERNGLLKSSPKWAIIDKNKSVLITKTEENTMKKRGLFIFLGVVLIISLFAGCGNNNVSDSEQQLDTQQSELESGAGLEFSTEANTEIGTEVGLEVETETEVVNSETNSEQVLTDVQTQAPGVKYTYKDMNTTMFAKSGVNVRDLPSTEGNKLGRLSEGQEVKVTGQCNETSWYRIEYNGSVGYVGNNYLLVDAPEEEKKYTEILYDEADICYVRKAVYMRDLPNDSGKILASLSVYNKVERLGFCNETMWWIINYNGIRGYIPDLVLSTAEPEYGYYYGTDGTLEGERASSGWQYEGGIKYYVWVTDTNEENGGHWEARYEGCEGNTCNIEELIPYLDECFNHDMYIPRDNNGNLYYGTYDGEKYELVDYIIMVYLGGGPSK